MGPNRENTQVNLKKGKVILLAAPDERKRCPGENSCYPRMDNHFTSNWRVFYPLKYTQNYPKSKPLSNTIIHSNKYSLYK